MMLGCTTVSNNVDISEQLGHSNVYISIDKQGLPSKACYWINGELVELQNGANTTSIFVDGEDVYVAGDIQGIPSKTCLWLNGVIISTIRSSNSTDLYIKQ